MIGSVGLSVVAIGGLLSLLAAISVDLLAVHATRRQVQTAADAAALGAAQVIAAAWHAELEKADPQTSRARQRAAACRALRHAHSRAALRARAYLAATAPVRLKSFRVLTDGRVEVRADAPARLYVARPVSIRVSAAAAARPYLGDVAFPGCR